jgi:hypothetical protein
MRLLTKELEAKLRQHPLYSHEKDKPENVKVLVKFFFPAGNWTWYVTEGEPQNNGDWLFFGFVRGFENELGYFTLSELEEVTVGGLAIERDLYFGEHTLQEVMDRQL